MESIRGITRTCTQLREIHLSVMGVTSAPMLSLMLRDCLAQNHQLEHISLRGSFFVSEEQFLAICQMTNLVRLIRVMELVLLFFVCECLYMRACVRACVHVCVVRSCESILAWGVF